MLVRWCKFNFVGGIGIGVQFAALFLLKTVLHLDYLVATALAVEAAVIHNFIWHEQFTWADRAMADRITSDRSRFAHTKLLRIRAAWRSSLCRLARFQFANGAISLVGNLALMKLIVGECQMNYLFANAIAIALCSLANFLVSDEWVFQSVGDS